MNARYLILVCAWLMIFGDSTTGQINELTPAEQSDGWLLLFDGETLFGWREAGNADFEVDKGVIRVTSGDICLLRTTTQFSDYVFKAEFRAAAGTNSGVFLRTPPVPRNPASDCYELNIAPPDNPFPTGSFVGRQRVTPDAAPNEWHAYEVRAEGAHWIVKLDGQVVLDYTDPDALGHGFIGLQHNEGTVEFRNVKLKPLGLNSIFNGVDLAGWKTYPEMASRFEVTEGGDLNVKGGRGQLETAERYGNFVLQLDAKCNGKGLNSGVFFRCQPGLEMMGYECQIHNGFRDGDRTRPVDCGTGGIFRRIDARRVVPDDLKWFRMTLVAHGPHFSAWVNGYQVTDWTDKRPPHDNPRRGLRLSAGTIMLQGHDATTDLSFRRVEIRETPVRFPQTPNQ